MAARKYDDQPALPLWGKANPKRGVPHVEKALTFVRDFPPETSLDRDRFGEWAQNQGYLIVATRSAGDAEWYEYTLKRGRLLQMIRKGGVSPKMQNYEVGPFRVRTVARNLLRVEALNEQRLINPATNAPVQSIINHVKRNLAYEFQSAEWWQLPEQLRHLAELVFKRVEHWQEDVEKEHFRMNEMLQQTMRAIAEARSNTRSGSTELRRR